ncbi:MAG: MATE family efflux transporter [Candidatus Izemoplasma sp.]
MTKEDKKNHLILHDKNIYKGLIILALPLMLNNLVKTIHDIIDLYFVGGIEGYGTKAISAISLTFPIFFMYLSLGIGLSIAGTALISQLIGSNQKELAKKYAAQLVILSLLIGIGLNVFSFFFSPMIMEWMGTTGYTLENSSNYLRIRSFELPGLFVFFAYTAIRQSSGDTVSPMIYGTLMVLVNILLTWLFIDILGYGVSGAAYATLFANLLGLPLIIRSLFFAKDGITLTKEDLVWDKHIIKDISVTAIPAAVGQAITAMGFIFMNSIILSFGDETVAAFSVVNRISMLILYPVMAIGGVSAAFIGQNIGNLNKERARKVFTKSIVLSVSIMVIGLLSFMTIRENLVSIFLEEESAIDLATKYMFFLLIGLPAMAVFQSFLGVFNGSGNTKFTLFISVSRLWLFRIPLILSFKQFTNLNSSGVWYAMLLSNFLVIFIGIALYRKVDFLPKVTKVKPNLVLEKAT